MVPKSFFAKEGKLRNKINIVGYRHRVLLHHCHTTVTPTSRVLRSKGVQNYEVKLCVQSIRHWFDLETTFKVEPNPRIVIIRVTLH